MKRISIKGRLTNSYSISELASKLNRSTITLRKFEERGILPFPNYRTKNKVLVGGKIILGDRIYTDVVVNKLVDIFKGISQGVKISDEQKRQIAIAFQEEKLFFERPI